MMFDDLINALRHCAECDHQGCAADCRFGKEHPLNFICVEYLQQEAADAIEDLQLYVDLYKDLTAIGEKIAREVIGKYPKWVPVTERLPENGAEVLAWSESGFSYVDWWIDGKWKVNGLVDGKYEHVTHWMPLPEPPKEDPDGQNVHQVLL